MQAEKILTELRRCGTAQNRKVYLRHGVAGEQFGVSYANLGKLSKKVGLNSDTAEILWQSEIHDARVLATMIADPANSTVSQLNSWIRDCDNYVLADAVAKFASKTQHAGTRMKQWMKSRDQWTSAAGWTLLAIHAVPIDDADSIYMPYLKHIETTIHKAPNQARHAMNNALIAIGIRSESLAKAAIRSARKIGKVDVDHGETGCKTPDAVDYILRTRARKK